MEASFVVGLVLSVGWGDELSCFRGMSRRCGLDLWWVCFGGGTGSYP